MGWDGMGCVCVCVCARARARVGGINALLTFRKVQGETFKETVRLARDAQVAFGRNLREGVVAFGKALNDPIANLGALSRKGIQFDDVQKEMIKNLWETGDAAGAQNIILEEMRNQFGGLAKDEAKTLAGALDGLGHAWDRMWERAGQTDKMQAFSGWIEGIIVDNTKLLDLISHSMSCNNLFWKISNMWDNFVCCEFKDNRGSLYGA